MHVEYSKEPHEIITVDHNSPSSAPDARLLPPYCATPGPPRPGRSTWSRWAVALEDTCRRRRGRTIVGEVIPDDGLIRHAGLRHRQLAVLCRGRCCLLDVERLRRRRLLAVERRTHASVPRQRREHPGVGGRHAAAASPCHLRRHRRLGEVGFGLVPVHDPRGGVVRVRCLLGSRVRAEPHRAEARGVHDLGDVHVAPPHDAAVPRPHRQPAAGHTTRPSLGPARRGRRLPRELDHAALHPGSNTLSPLH